jgi:hypothetical protein
MIGSSQLPRIHEPTVDVMFKYKTTDFAFSEKQLDSVYMKVDEMARKYVYVMVTANATSDELKIDPNIDYKRAMKIIKYYTEKFQIEGFRFLIQPILRKSIYDHDIYSDKTALVNFYPIKRCNCRD